MGNGAIRLTVGELDDIPDIVTVNTTGTVSILKGDGIGGFSAPTSKSVPAGSSSIDSGDMDNDGDLDVITFDGADYAVLLNSGNGTLGNAAVHDAGFATESRIRLGQADGNPRLDVFYTDGYNINCVLGAGNSGWNPGVKNSEQLTGGDMWFDLTEFEFDGDGLLDYVVMGQWESKIAIANGNGNGTFDQFGQTTVCDNCTATEVHAADVDGDDHPDVIVSFESGIAVLIANPNGTFKMSELYQWAGADFTTSGDLDNDGDLDLAVASNTTGNIGVFFNNGDGSFEDAMVVETAAPKLYDVRIHDLDEDGALDLATTYTDGNKGQVAVFLMDP